MKNIFEFCDNNENIEFIKILDYFINDEYENINTMFDVGIDISIINKHKYNLYKLKKLRRKLFNKTCKNFINNLFIKK